MTTYFFRLFSIIFIGVTLACHVANSSTTNLPAVAETNLNVPPVAAKDEQTAVFAGGCFWGVEAVFEHVKGVSDAVSGYSGGTAKTANYDEVSGGKTKHAESVRVTFDPKVVTYEQLLKVFFAVAHNPTELNRQGPDIGSQYRSVVFYANDEQKRAVENYIAELTKNKVFRRAVVTQIVSLEKFYPAEDYHQNFLRLNPQDPYIVEHDLPKLENLRKLFPDLYKAQ